MFRRIGLLLTALALFFIAGGHWAVLQGVAWAGMVVNYTQSTGSVRAAVAQTFDGQHPCELCRQVAAGRQHDDRQQAPASSLSKIEKSAEKAIATDPAAAPFVRLALLVAWPMHAPADGSVPAAQPPTPPPPPRRA